MPRFTESVRFQFFAAFGVFALVLWTLIAFALHEARRETFANASSEGRNLARSLAEHVEVSIRTLDLSLLHLRAQWIDDSDHFADHVAQQQKYLERESVSQVGVVGANGRIAWDSLPGWRSIDVSDREHFKVHKERGSDTLYISKPVLGRLSHQWSIKFTRPIYDRQHRFAGVVGFSVSPPALEQKFDDIDVGADYLSVVRSDGYFLARSRNFGDVERTPLAPATTPGLRPADPVFGEFRRVSTLDGVDSLISYRKLDDYRLTVYVRQPINSMLAPYYRQRAAYLVSGALITSLLFALTLLLISRRIDKELAQRNRARLAAIVQHSDDGIVSLDLDGRIESWNAAAERLFGYTAAEARGGKAQDLLIPADRLEEVRQARARIARGESVAPIDTESVARDGRRIEVSVSMSPIKDSHGRVRGISAILHDISERKRAQRDLEREKKFSESILQSLPGIVFLLDQRLRRIRWNARLEDVFGYSAAELAALAPLALVAPEDHTAVAQAAAAVFRSGAAEIEAHLLTKDCRRMPYLYLGRRIYIDNKPHLLGIGIDISERRRVEQALRASEERLRLQIQRMPIGLVVWDPEFRVQTWNPAAERIFGFSAEEAFGKHPYDFIVPREAQPQVDEIWRRLLAGDTTAHSVNENQTKDGRTIVCEWNNTPLREPDGTITGALAMVQDVTERMRAEEARGQLVAIVANSHDAIISRTLDGDIRSWNPGAERMFGYAAAEVLGKHVSIIVPADRARENVRHTQILNEGGSIPPYETVRCGKGGRRIDVSLGISPIKDSSGRLTSVAIIARDITAFKRVEDKIRRLNAELEQRVSERTAQLEATVKEMERANEELAAFSYSVAHDLRTPLRGINGFSGILAADYADRLDTTAQGYLKRIQAASIRMGDVMDDLLALAHAGRAELRRERVDLSALAQEVVASLRSSEPQREGEFEIAPGMLADADPGLMRIALDNLLGNAWKFTSRTERAKIGFGPAASEGAPVYAVRDNGAGFDPAFSVKLFEQFQRLHSDSEYEGTGVGLAIVARVIRRHGGRIWAEGAVGRGASFYFTLA